MTVRVPFGCVKFLSGLSLSLIAVTIYGYYDGQNITVLSTGQGFKRVENNFTSEKGDASISTGTNDDTHKYWARDNMKANENDHKHGIQNEATRTPETINRLFVCHGPTGRLGNFMFDVATAIGIAKTLNYTFVIRSSNPILKHFDIKKQVITEEPNNLLRITLKQWRNATWRANTDYLSHNLSLTGFFRVWRYFKDAGHEVREAFTIKPVYQNEALAFLRSNTPRNRTLIGVHVRRGDFLLPKIQKMGQMVASRKYLNKSMEYFRKQYSDALFVVASNDMAWCKKNIVGHDVIYSGFEEAILDMALLSLCNHTVVTTGTFGWWAGWLSGGTVVYCKDFPTPGSMLDKQILFRDELYPTNWIGMGNE